MDQPSKWSLVLVPDHLGVINVGGRVGACHGPDAFEKLFARLKGSFDPTARLASKIRVSGLDGPIEANHRQAADAVARAHAAGGLSVVVGGGHDHGFSHLMGLKKAKAVRWGCINIDAHLDLRKPEPVTTSGSPFYLAIEAGVIEPGDLIEFGIQSHCNGPPLWKYAYDKKIPVVKWQELRGGDVAVRFAEELKQLASRVDAVAISLDLDALSQDHCPGVSAPQAEGFSSREVIAMMELAGAHKKVQSLGIFELNPEHDVAESTARVAATAAYHFIEAALGSGRSS